MAASLIWGINTLFLLEAGLTNTEAFAANAFFTAGQVLFEIPTGIIADTFGRRLSYLLGTATLLITTLIYLLLWQTQSGFWMWAFVSMFLGLGFTFFSGAVEAWLVDALTFSEFKGNLDDVFAKGQIVSGIAMLTGSTLGGFLAEKTNLGVPYLVRSLLLFVSLLIAGLIMKDIGFQPRKMGRAIDEMKAILFRSFENGLKIPAVRWVMLISPFVTGVGFYVFYASQPSLLELYGNERAYSIAGVVSALVAGSQILGGILVPYAKSWFSRRTTILAGALVLGSMALFFVGNVQSFWFALVGMGAWSFLSSLMTPVRQAYLNTLIPSRERATILSFDGLLGSTGGVVIQPLLGRSADLWGYPSSIIGAGIFQLCALPFVILARRQKSSADSL